MLRDLRRVKTTRPAVVLVLVIVTNGLREDPEFAVAVSRYAICDMRRSGSWPFMAGRCVDGDSWGWPYGSWAGKGSARVGASLVWVLFAVRRFVSFPSVPIHSPFSVFSRFVRRRVPPRLQPRLRVWPCSGASHACTQRARRRRRFQCSPHSFAIIPFAFLRFLSFSSSPHSFPLFPLRFSSISPANR